MGKYILKRLVYMVVVFVLISFLMFCLYNLIPSDPARVELEGMRQELRPEEYELRYQQLRSEMGLDDSIFIRFGRWVGVVAEKQSGEMNGLLQGNLGYSTYFKTNVLNVIPDRISNTVFINIFVTILALGITIPLGIYCAVHKRGKVDQVTQVITIIGYSIPIYIIALVFIWFFAVTLEWFPVMGIKTPGSDYTGMQATLDKLYYLGLPILVMTFGSLGGMTRYVRSAMIESLSMDYIRTARAKGLKEKVVVYSHAWRNALLPIVTVIIGWFLSIFSGSLIVENTFALNGMGNLYILGLTNHDYELVLATQMFYTVVSLVGALLMDLSYGLVDPRVRVDK
ncbi:MAG: ABC transporter permease [Oscillospiraceae bacterium]|nr:ABC transporter permease [Oscillospiraceae bacterium]